VDELIEGLGGEIRVDRSHQRRLNKVGNAGERIARVIRQILIQSGQGAVGELPDQEHGVAIRGRTRNVIAAKYGAATRLVVDDDIVVHVLAKLFGDDACQEVG